VQFEITEQTRRSIEGPDEDACVWLVAGAGPEAVVLLLGQRDAVATKMANWLAAIDFGE
jgi:hypothetical protein